MRILYSSNAVWANSGYGIQGRELLPRFQALGHEVAQFAWYGLQGGMMNANGIPIYPGYRDAYGNDITPHHVAHFKADLLITLIDIWVLDPDMEARCGVPWLAWFPIDHAPVSDIILERVRKCSYPVQYSQFGLAETERVGVPCGYIPHGVSPIYTPGDQAAARAQLHLPADAFLVSMVAANKGFPDRKGFQWQLEAFARFQRRHAEALLYLHTARNAPDGLDLDALIGALGIPPQAVRFVDQYAQVVGLNEEYLRDIYRASNVLLAAGMSEGFGIPIAEAQACGCPVITTDFSAMTELTINGIATEPAGRFYQPLFRAWQAIPSVANVTAALEKIYGWSEAKRRQMAAKGVAHMQREYNWDAIVANYWAPMLARVERGDPITPRPEAPPPNGHVAAEARVEVEA